MSRFYQIISNLKTTNFKEILKSKAVKRSVIIICSALLFLIIIIICFRNIFLQHYLDHKISSFNDRYHAELVIGSAKFSGLAGVKLSEVSLKAQDQDTLLKFGKLTVHVSFWKVIFGHIKTKDLELENFYLNIIKADSVNNYSFLMSSKKDTSIAETETRTGYSELFNRVLRLIFDILPVRVNVVNFNIAFHLKDENLTYHLDNYRISDKLFKTGILVTENDSIAKWTLEGSLDKDKMQVNAKLYSSDTANIKLPYVDRKLGLKLLFDTILFSFKAESLQNNLVKFQTIASVHGLNINHPRISKQDVKIADCSFYYVFNIAPDYFELDSTSYINLNKLSFNAYLKYRPKPTKQVWLKMVKNNLNASELFESLPEGLFDNLQGLKATGQLSYRLNFFVDMSQVDSLIFESKLTRQDFKILKYGNTSLSKMSSEFSYTAYEKGEPVKTFEVGPSNPDFRSIDQISSYLKNAVLLCEDNGFMWHNGFLVESFRGAIIENIKRKRFARGGSTITMQLVKNVFLNRNKTVVRKLEEMMIVWLIESNHLTSKDRMFEVYLNIIEWGPMIYGANEASHFYFKKDVSQLSMPEALFMASIIPRPKYYQYAFDSGQVLKSYFTEHMQLVAGKMLKKEVINQDELDRFVPQVKITGPAKMKFVKADTINILQLEPED
jgi:hypothetical protein